MEKLLYLLWKNEAESSRHFNERLLGPLKGRLRELGAWQLKINVADEAVAPAAALRQSSMKPVFDAVLSFWVNAAHFRAPFQAAIEAAVARAAGYLVLDSVAIPNTAQLAADGERTPGWAQIAVLQRPPRLTQEAWLEIWLGSHTGVAIDTQSTFHYCQNVVVRPLTYGAPPISAVVEESFPAEAMTDSQVFFAAAGDEARYQQHLKRMMDSCVRFIDFDKIDVVPTSEYRVGGWADLRHAGEVPR